MSGWLELVVEEHRDRAIEYCRTPGSPMFLGVALLQAQVDGADRWSQRGAILVLKQKSTATRDTDGSGIDITGSGGDGGGNNKASGKGQPRGESLHLRGARHHEKNVMTCSHHGDRIICKCWEAQGPMLARKDARVRRELAVWARIRL